MRSALGRGRLLTASIAAAGLLLSAHPVVALADEPAPVQAQVQVTGDVRTPTTFTLDALRGLPSRTEAVTFDTRSGSESHTYTGCPLDAVITAADPVVDAVAKHPQLTIAILATGADGYAATLAWADVSPELAARPALVAYAEDGNSLGQPQLVVPADLSGARYVRDLTELRVVNLAHP
jgi:DMSO/TMAO reductase YedYZ molybdopterin-dependent catalytic subunit